MERICEINGAVSLKYRWFYKASDKKVNFYNTLEDIPDCICEALNKRNVSTEEDFITYFDTPLGNLLNPFMLSDMEIAVERIFTAIKSQELICIYGDYDVDGVTSTTLLYLFLKEIGSKVIYYIPNRLDEGYGLNKDAMDEIREKNVQLIITVDCGMTAVNEVQYAKSLGMDIIITDHHQPAESIPDAAVAILNPLKPGDTYPFKSLCGVGVAFKLVMALRFFLKQNNYFKGKIPNIKKYLDLVALGTIADVVPLIGENRIFVKHGLHMMTERKVRIGLLELMKLSGLNQKKITTTHVGYIIAPRINAVGRMGCSDRGVKLLITDNVTEARWLAEELNQENKYRQDIEKNILKESFEKLKITNCTKNIKALFYIRKNGTPE
jgi:single-stranded-DNA-specific exonuclease